MDSRDQGLADQWLTNQYASSQVFTGDSANHTKLHWVNDFRVGYPHYYQAFLA